MVEVGPDGWPIGEKRYHCEKVIDADNCDAAQAIAATTYGWGAWSLLESDYQKNCASKENKPIMEGKE